MPRAPATPSLEEIRARAAEVLEAAWDDFRGYCFPHADVYGHLWLWDSCFHAIGWAALGDRRAWRELSAVFVAQLPSGFVPHMRYASPSLARGPLSYCSSYTQPPVYAHAAACLAAAGLPVPAPLLAHIADGFRYLWEHRRIPEGLLRIVHPWEAGTDDSPRWDAWIGHSNWNRPEWTGFDLDLIQTTTFAATGEAEHNSDFEVASAGFNAIAAHGMAELSRLTADGSWMQRSRELGAAIDEYLWDENEGLWHDLPIVGPDDTSGIPTLDGALGALSTDDEDRARRALAQLRDERRFAAPFGLAYVARDHPTYRGDLYWRGAAWPQMNHLARVAAARWNDEELEGEIAAMTRRGAAASNFAELWQPETGRARGAVPQTWAAVAAVADVRQPAVEA